jgi:hypothetical protein
MGVNKQEIRDHGDVALEIFTQERNRLRKKPNVDREKDAIYLSIYRERMADKSELHQDGL